MAQHIRAPLPPPPPPPPPPPHPYGPGGSQPPQQHHSQHSQQHMSHPPRQPQHVSAAAATHSGANATSAEARSHAYAYGSNSRQPSSSFGDFHIGHLGAGSVAGASLNNSSTNSAGGADTFRRRDGAPLSSVGIPASASASAAAAVADDADVAAGRGLSAATFPPAPSHSHASRQPPPQPRRPRCRHQTPNHALDAFRDSEADFLQLSSAASMAGGSTTGYLSGADSIVSMPSPPTSGNMAFHLSSLNLMGRDKQQGGNGDDGDEEPREPFQVLGVDITHLSRKKQFVYCAGGVFFFSLLYGFLQELISVTLCCRQLGLFLAVAQFSGYTLWSYLLREYVNEKQARKARKAEAMAAGSDAEDAISLSGSGNATSGKKYAWGTGLIRSIFSRDERSVNHSKRGPQGKGNVPVPIVTYLGLSLLRAIDLGATNLAMQYVNYPAKTLMKSARVVFTMLFGVLIAKRRYKSGDYGVVLLMVTGLGIFMHADANSDAVFQPFGIMLLVLSLSCDGAISNMSESLMTQFRVGQDEFIFRLYSIATLAITFAAAFKGDLAEGIRFLFLPGTYDEITKGEEPTWSASSKVFVVVTFSTMGFFGSSCAAAITKHFGALTMSITSTARKATTLFLSFALFNNVCTAEHIFGIVLFIAALIMKSLRASRKGRKRKGDRKSMSSPLSKLSRPVEAEMASLVGSIEIGNGGADSSPALYQRKKNAHSPARSHIHADAV